MNEKKSPFGDLCHQYRGKLHLSEQAMGQKIEEMGYRLGTKPDSNKQPVISQFERGIDPEGSNHKQHRDPPLAYIETCAKLFGLSAGQKYSLFVAALQSSEKIVIDAKAIEGGIKGDILNIIASLVLSCAKVDKTLTMDEKNKKESRYYSGPGRQEGKLLDVWNTLNEASKRFINEIQQSSLEYTHGTPASVKEVGSI